MALQNLKKVLLSLIVVGALGTLTVQRVYASFSTESYNEGSTMTSGTLTMELGMGATTCKSASATSTSYTDSTCTQLFTGSPLAYPGVVQTVNVSVKNSGSIDGRTLEVWMPQLVAGPPVKYCVAQTSTGVPAGSVGGGDPCAANGIEFYIQETQSDYTTAVQCWWPNNNTTCGAFGSIANWITNGYTAAPGLRLYNFLAQNPSAALAAGTSTTPATPRYFVIGMEEPPTASNTLQGEAATFQLTWHMDN